MSATLDREKLKNYLGDAAMIVPPSDFLALAAAMRTMFDEPPARQRLAALGRARAEAEFDSRKQADRLLDAYRSLM